MGIIFLNYICLSDNNYIHQIIEENFIKEVGQSDLPVFIKISAEWCSNCKSLESMMTEILDKFQDYCIFASIDIDKSNDFLQKLLQDIFRKHMHIISGFPSVLVFYKGCFKQSFLGFFANQEDLSKKINEILMQLDR